MDAKEVTQCLKERFFSPAWIFKAEFCLSVASASRVDAVALQTGYSCGINNKLLYAFLGLEIKVSRGDFLSEIKNPAKRQIAYVGTDAVFFATPKKLVNVKEIPSDCGLIECWKKDDAHYTRIKKYPDNYVPPIRRMLTTDENGRETYDFNKLTPIDRHVAVSFIRAFNPERINNQYLMDAQTWRLKAEDRKWKIADLEDKIKRLSPPVE